MLKQVDYDESVCWLIEFENCWMKRNPTLFPSVILKVTRVHRRIAGAIKRESRQLSHRYLAKPNTLGCTTDVIRVAK